MSWRPERMWMLCLIPWTALLALPPGVARAAPAAPLDLEAQIGDGAVSLAWRDGASAPRSVSYLVEVTPPQPEAQVSVVGTRALVRGLTNGTAYTLSVIAQSSAGSSEAASVKATPVAVNLQSEAPVVIEGDPASASGIFDASVVRVTQDETWLAYSGVDYYEFVGVLVQDVATQLAHSTDGGRTFKHVRTLGAPRAATITDELGLACPKDDEDAKGGKCSGRWVYETPALVEDPADPDPAARWKVFAHKYFLYPPKAGQATVYALGAIVMWTAGAPDGPWSPETSVLGWNLTPRELRPKHNVNTLHPELSKCLAIAEGGVAAGENGLDLVFACTEPAESEPFPQKIVMLRSRDHARSFEYVATLLRAQDAAILKASHFTAPSLLPSAGGGQVLVATPAVKTLYAGCVVIPFADPRTGQLFRDAKGIPLGLLGVKPLPGHAGGACAADKSLDTLLMNDLDRASEKPFRLLRRQ
jgi:hypothetical protein